MLSRIDRTLKPLHDVGLLVLRLFIGARLFYGVIDNVVSWEHMLEFAAFLESFGFPIPVVSAVVSVAVQFVGSLMLLTGYRIRIASLLLVVNFIVAIVFVHLASGDSFEAMTPPLAMLFGSLTLALTGSGKYALGIKDEG